MGAYNNVMPGDMTLALLEQEEAARKEREATPIPEGQRAPLTRVTEQFFTELYVVCGEFADLRLDLDRMSRFFDDDHPIADMETAHRLLLFCDRVVKSGIIDSADVLRAQYRGSEAVERLKGALQRGTADA